MSAAGFEPAIPAMERPQTHALDCAVTGIGMPITHILEQPPQNRDRRQER